VRETPSGSCPAGFLICFTRLAKSTYVDWPGRSGGQVSGRPPKAPLGHSAARTIVLVELMTPGPGSDRARLRVRSRHCRLRVMSSRGQAARVNPIRDEAPRKGGLVACWMLCASVCCTQLAIVVSANRRSFIKRIPAARVILRATG